MWSNQEYSIPFLSTYLSVLQNYTCTIATNTFHLSPIQRRRKEGSKFDPCEEEQRKHGIEPNGVVV